MTHPVDVHVGQRLRHRRWLLGMTQQRLANEVGIKFQQIQKYETGANRVSASRLWAIANALDVPVSFFFDGMSDETTAALPNGESVGGGCAAGPDPDVLQEKESLELLRAYYAIPEPQRRRLYELTRSMVDAPS